MAHHILNGHQIVLWNIGHLLAPKDVDPLEERRLILPQGALCPGPIVYPYVKEVPQLAADGIGRGIVLCV